MAEDDLEEGLEEDLEAIIDGEDSSSGSKMKKIILFVVAPILVLSAIGAGLYFSGTLDKALGKKPDCEAILANIEKADDLHGELAEEIPDECLKTADAENEEGESNSYVEPGVFLEIPNLIVNFNSDDGRPKYLKLSIQIEVPDNEAKKKLEDGMPRIVDQFQTYLRELRLEDLKGSSGLYRMRIELKSRVATAIPGVDVRDVLFQEILIQQ